MSLFLSEPDCVGSGAAQVSGKRARRGKRSVKQENERKARRVINQLVGEGGENDKNQKTEKNNKKTKNIPEYEVASSSPQVETVGVTSHGEQTSWLRKMSELRVKRGELTEGEEVVLAEWVGQKVGYPTVDEWKRLGLKGQYPLVPSDVDLVISKLWKENSIDDREYSFFYKYYHRDVLPDQYYIDMMEKKPFEFVGLDLTPKLPNLRYSQQHVWDDEVAFLSEPFAPQYDQRGRATLVVCALPLSGKSTLQRHFAQSETIHAVDIDDMVDWNMLRQLGVENNSPEWVHLAKQQISDWKDRQPIDGRHQLFLLHAPWQAEPLGLRVGAYLWPSLSLLEPHKEKEKIRYDITMKYRDGMRRGAKKTGVPLIKYSDYNMLPELLEAYFALGGDGLVPRADKGADRAKRLQDAERLIQASWHKEVLRRDANPEWSVEQAALMESTLDKALGGDDGDLSTWLTLYYPYHQRALQLRARANHDIAAKYIHANMARHRLFMKHILLRCSGMGLMGMMNVLSNGLLRAAKRPWFVALAQAGIFEKGMKEIQKQLKDIHNAVRRTLLVPRAWLKVAKGMAYDDLLYGDQMVGRFANILLAADTTIEDRLTPIQHVAYDGHGSLTHTAWLADRDKTFAGMADMFKQALEERIALEDLDVETLQSYYIAIGASGSAASGKEQLRHVQLDKPANKRFWLGELTQGEILDAPWLPADVRTSLVEKTELGKLRQLIPGPVWHWLMESMVLWLTETPIYRHQNEVMMEKSAVENLARIRQRELDVDMARMREAAICAADYADFNITHDYDDMRAMFQAFGKACGQIKFGGLGFGGQSLPQFLEHCCDWLVRAFDNMWARTDAGDGEYHKLERGLWTGWRSTAFINIEQNRNYALSMQAQAVREIGQELLEYFQSMGDDVHARARSIRDVIFAISTLIDNGHEMQGAKQLVGAHAEFLRQMYDGEKVQGNLARSVCSFWSSDMQTAEIRNGREFVKGCSAAVDGLIRRGADQTEAEILRDVVIAHYSRIQGEDDIAQLHRTEWFYTPEVDGGYGCNRYGQVPLPSAVKVEVPKIQIRPSIAGARHEGLRALRHKVDSRLYSKKMLLIDHELLESAALKSAEGTMLPTEVSRLVVAEQRAAEMTTIRACNKRAPRPFKAAVDLKLVEMLARQTIEHFLHATPEQIRAWPGAAVEELVNAVEAVALRQGAVAPAILLNLRDVTTGKKLEFEEAVSRLADQQTSQLLAAVAQIVPSWYIREMLMTDGHQLMNTGGVLPAELNPVLVHFHCQLFLQVGLHNMQAITSDEARSQWAQMHQVFVDVWRQSPAAKRYQM